MTNAETVGWTKAEFDAAPEAITRLHRRILDLEDENVSFREALIALRAARFSSNFQEHLDAWQAADALLQSEAE